MDGQRNVKALLSQIFGIVSVVVGLCGGGLPFGVAAIILGSLAKKDDPENSQAKLGFTLGIVGIAVSVIATIVIIAIRVAATVAAYR
jgi:hypothetical protein